MSVTEADGDRDLERGAHRQTRPADMFAVVRYAATVNLNQRYLRAGENEVDRDLYGQQLACVRMCDDDFLFSS